MAPFLLITGLMAAWQQLFKSQKYEMYLMSEGERVWYWRNRTENERWFWEMYAWRIIAFRKWGGMQAWVLQWQASNQVTDC